MRLSDKISPDQSGKAGAIVADRTQPPGIYPLTLSILPDLIKPNKIHQIIIYYIICLIFFQAPQVSGIVSNCCRTGDKVKMHQGINGLLDTASFPMC